jgi:cysteine desulfurase / selenocysteine lyase
MSDTPSSQICDKRIYLDHAATSWPKLPSATAAALEFIQECGATSGRGSYRSAQIADRWITDARLAVAKLIHAPNANCIALCNSGTHALNAALQGLLREGDHVVTTAMEHNSVLRPLSQLAAGRTSTMTVVDCSETGCVSATAIDQAMQPNTRWIIIGHASNVTGEVQDIEPIADVARLYGAGLILDASQTLGYLPIDVATMGIDVLAAAGHKGLRAWAGTGLLYVAPKYQSKLRPLMTGGTGSSSELINAVPVWPQSVEVGNLNLPGIVSLAVGARDADTSQAWRPLYRSLLAGLRAISGIRLYTATEDRTAIPVVSLTIEGWDNHDLANVLDANFGIETRAGLHCAALVHNFIGTQADGGTLRISLGHTSTPDDVRAVLVALRTITGQEIEDQV